MTIGRSGSAATTTDPDAMATNAFATAVGNPDLVDAQVKGYLTILLDRDHTPEEVAKAALEHYKKCKPAAKAKIDEHFVGADDRKKGKTSGTSKTTGGGSVPREVQTKAMDLYRANKVTKSGDDLRNVVVDGLRSEFGTAHTTEIYLTAYNNAKEA